MSSPKAHAASMRSLGSDRRGNVAVEFALVAPLLLTILVGGMEFARLMWVITGLHYATEEGARCYAMKICTSTTAQARAAAVAPEMAFATTNFAATKITCGYQVVGTYQFAWVPNANLMKWAAPNLSATVCFP
ncbi:MAG TPA: TadE family protein [Caulobacteraceae bacterium]|jgi:Flp pilus assembly protein TadG|nr:TadE family protein [Caulobacteraceae bacterium]